MNRYGQGVTYLANSITPQVMADAGYPPSVAVIAAKIREGSASLTEVEEMLELIEYTQSTWILPTEEEVN